MKKKAVIVESPTKTRTLSRFLGDDYEILASMGHVRDLPEGEMAVDVENDFEPRYVTIPRQKSTVKELKDALKDVEEVYLASDPDREGEAIAWHLMNALDIPNARRIEFNEITEEAVTEALAHPGEIDMDRVNAQQARRILDRLVGYRLSPLLWERISGKGRKSSLSAGRVQSVALRLICEREFEIAAFEPEEYWSIDVALSVEDTEEQIEAAVKSYQGEDLELGNEDQVTPHVEALQEAQYCVAEIEKKTKRRTPKAPYRTSTLQRDAANRLGFTARKTMMIAQQLYEGVDTEEGAEGLITYMRTDSTRISASARKQAVSLIHDRFGKKFVGKGSSDEKPAGAQEAHEAVRPTSVNRTPEQMEKLLNRDQARLYELIWRRFVASQMSPAVYEQVSVAISADEYTLTATGSVLKFAGYLAVQPQQRDEAEAEILRGLEEGQTLNLVEVIPEQHFTKPPARYTEASLVRELEENGIGRPSTYAPTIETLRNREYVVMRSRSFIPTPLGLVVNEYLVEHFPHIIDVDFTARIEEKLDTVQAGEIDWRRVLAEFYEDFDEEVESASEAEPKIVEGEKCPKCGGRLVEKYSLYGKFAGCENYPECDYTKDMLDDILPQQEPEEVGRECPECGKPLLYRHNKRGQKFIGCSGFPECKYTEKVDRNGKPLPKAQATDMPCGRCDGWMIVRHGRRGKFLGCSNYPKCRNTLPFEVFEQSDYEIVDQTPDEPSGEPEIDTEALQ
ncbi:MAG: type I DNA topoisomerase, partial [Armatimonadota bacterium]